MGTQLMHAAWYEKQGPARDVIQYGDVPTPEPGAGEVRVKVQASGVNPSDIKARSGWGEGKLQFPRIIPHQDVYIMAKEAKQTATREITAALEAGALRHNIAQRFPLTEVAAAHEAQESGKMIGKAIIEIA